MNKITGLSAALAASAGALAVAPAVAAPITLSHSVTLSTLLQQGQSANLSFDINAFLTAQGHSASEVVGGEISLFGFSDASYANAGASADYNLRTEASGAHAYQYSYTQWYSYSYSCGFWGMRTCWSSYPYTQTATAWVQDYARYADRDLYRTDNVADQLQLQVGQTVLTDTVDTRSQSATDFGVYLYDGTSVPCGNDTCSRTTLYHRERTLYSALAGDLNLTTPLDAAALLDLQGDGILGLTVGAPVGQVALRSLSFNLLLREPLLLPVAAPSAGPSASTNVPEPGSMALGAVALAAALAAGRLRARRPVRDAATTPPGPVVDDADA